MHKIFGEDRTCSYEDMIADIQTHRHTHRQTDRHAHHNTPLPYRVATEKQREREKFIDHKQINDVTIQSAYRCHLPRITVKEKVSTTHQSISSDKN